MFIDLDCLTTAFLQNPQKLRQVSSSTGNCSVPEGLYKWHPDGDTWPWCLVKRWERRSAASWSWLVNLPPALMYPLWK